jgi:hypothetical protein
MNRKYEKDSWDKEVLGAARDEVHAKQRDIVREYRKNGYTDKIHSLQHSLICCRSARVRAVDRVTSTRWASVPGRDGVQVSTNKEKWQRVEMRRKVMRKFN